jgi:hypothetical protein
MAVLVKKTFFTIFIVGLFVLAILSILGLVYLTQMSFSDSTDSNGQYCGAVNQTQRDLARLATVTIWMELAWIILGGTMQLLQK